MKKFLFYLTILLLSQTVNAQVQYRSGNTYPNTSYYSSSLGYTSKSQGKYGAFASGYYAEARGRSSFALGHSVYAFGDHSVVMGLFSSAVGTKSFAIGDGAKAYATGSYAFGRGINNNSSYSFATGYYNVGLTNSIFEVGYGSSSSRKNLFTVLKTGETGIGTLPESGYMLKVAGKIKSENLKLTGDSPSADYVFEDDYQLMPINELKSFVDTHKHLPEIPTADEFKENGYNVGQFHNLLLKKVEELTLYIIELEGKISGLEEAGKQL